MKTTTKSENISRALNQYLIRADTVDEVEGSSGTEFIVHPSPGQDVKIIRRLKTDLAITLGVRHLEIEILDDYAILRFPGLMPNRK